MAPKSLSIFLSPLSFPPQSNSSKSQIPPQFKVWHPSSSSQLSIVIRCQVAPLPDAQTRQMRPGHSTPALASETELEGTGAAASTRGQLFLEHHQAKMASKVVLASTKTQKKKTKEHNGFNRVAAASCYGCGAPLQTVEVDAPGYVDQDTYALKKKHKQLRTILCGRCKLLSHGRMITAVGGNGGYAGGKQFVTAEQLREKLSHLRLEKALIVKLVDIVDFNGSFLSRVRDLVGANPIILVITKIDLLPKGTDLNCIGDWVVEATMKKKLNVMSVHLTSSKSLVGITGVASEIQKEKKGRDVYILGSANVGKSAFFSALLSMMGQKDPIAAAAQRYKPIQSAVPGTTLGPIQINAFLGGGKLYDTPGVHLHHRQAAVVHSDDLPSLAPQSRLRGQSFPKPMTACKTEAEMRTFEHGLNDFSIFWGGLVRVDIIKVLPSTRLVFYGPKALPIHLVRTEEADEFYQKNLGNLLTPPSGKHSSEEWAGLEIERKLQLKYEDTKGPISDVAISGLGWISVEPNCKSLEATPDLNPELVSLDELKLVVKVPKPVEVFLRPPLPVGKVGVEWYQYRELTEVEEETRPKWYF